MHGWMNGKILKELDILLGKKGKWKEETERMIPENLGEETLLQMNSNSALQFCVGKGKKIISKTNFLGYKLKPYKKISKAAG